jgi:biopolymer transport protein ExbD
MSKFRKSSKKSVQAISTASLPDIVFMLLFFFMVTTVLREVTLKVQVKVPSATEIEKLENKSLVSYIYIGRPLKSKGNALPRIQLNDAFAEPDDIREFIAAEREPIDENQRRDMTVSLKIDHQVEMGIVSDVKQALRRANALRINYTTFKGDPLKDVK